MYSNNRFNFPELSKYVAFLHASSGCDTVSTFFKQEKSKLFKIFKSNPDYCKLIDVLYKNDSPCAQIANNMCQIISLLYCKKTQDKLNEHRFKYFKKSTSRSSVRLEHLPPTERAAKQHAFRIFLQLHKWLGNEYDITQWGWKLVDTLPIPIYTQDLLIPEKIIKKISCCCATSCKAKACICRKKFLKCTSVCKHCDCNECENLKLLLKSK